MAYFKITVLNYNPSANYTDDNNGEYRSTLDTYNYLPNVLAEFYSQEYEKQLNDSQQKSFAYCYDEEFSIKQNAQKTLSFSLDKRIIKNGETIENPFIPYMTIGTQLCLEDKFNNQYLFTIKEVKYTFKNKNTVLSVKCQDSFSYQMSRQNDGYEITNDKDSEDFIGAKTIDWWVENKIIPDCHITSYTYIPLYKGLYLNKYNKYITYQWRGDFEESNVDKIIKYSYAVSKGDTTSKYLDYYETLSYSGSGSADSILIDLATKLGFELHTYEHSTDNNNFITYFWFEPIHNEIESGIKYSPFTSVQSFDFSRNGDKLTTVLNVNSIEYDDELVSLLPDIPNHFLKIFSSDYWNQKNHIYKENDYSWPSGWYKSLLESTDGELQWAGITYNSSNTTLSRTKTALINSNLVIPIKNWVIDNTVDNFIISPIYQGYQVSYDSTDFDWRIATCTNSLARNINIPYLQYKLTNNTTNKIISYSYSNQEIIVTVDNTKTNLCNLIETANLFIYDKNNILKYTCLTSDKDSTDSSVIKYTFAINNLWLGKEISDDNYTLYLGSYYTFSNDELLNSIKNLVYFTDDNSSITVIDDSSNWLYFNKNDFYKELITTNGIFLSDSQNNFISSLSFDTKVLKLDSNPSYLQYIDNEDRQNITNLLGTTLNSSTFLIANSEDITSDEDIQLISLDWTNQYQLTSDDEDFAAVVDQIPWLENKIINFDYLKDHMLLSNKDLNKLNTLIYDDLRIANGKLLYYTKEYYASLNARVNILADIQSKFDTLGASFYNDVTSNFAKEGKLDDLKSFDSSYKTVFNGVNFENSLLNFNQIYNQYLNDFINAQQRFLKNIYKFREFFNATTSFTSDGIQIYNDVIQITSDKKEETLSDGSKRYTWIGFNNNTIAKDINDLTIVNDNLLEYSWSETTSSGEIKEYTNDYNVSDLMFFEDDVKLDNNSIITPDNFLNCYIPQYLPETYFTPVNTKTGSVENIDISGRTQYYECFYPWAETDSSKKEWLLSNQDALLYDSNNGVWKLKVFNDSFIGFTPINKEILDSITFTNNYSLHDKNNEKKYIVNLQSNDLKYEKVNLYDIYYNSIYYDIKNASGIVHLWKDLYSNIQLSFQNIKRYYDAFNWEVTKSNIRTSFDFVSYYDDSRIKQLYNYSLYYLDYPDNIKYYELENTNKQMLLCYNNNYNNNLKIFNSDTYYNSYSYSYRYWTSDTDWFDLGTWGISDNYQENIKKYRNDWDIINNYIYSSESDIPYYQIVKINNNDFFIHDDVNLPEFNLILYDEFDNSPFYEDSELLKQVRLIDQNKQNIGYLKLKDNKYLGYYDYCEYIQTNTYTSIIEYLIQQKKLDEFKLNLTPETQWYWGKGVLNFDQHVDIDNLYFKPDKIYCYWDFWYKNKIDQIDFNDNAFLIQECHWSNQYGGVGEEIKNEFDILDNYESYNKKIKLSQENSKYIFNNNHSINTLLPIQYDKDQQVYYFDPFNLLPNYFDKDNNHKIILSSKNMTLYRTKICKIEWNNRLPNASAADGYSYSLCYIYGYIAKDITSDIFVRLDQALYNTDAKSIDQLVDFINLTSDNKQYIVNHLYKTVEWDSKISLDNLLPSTWFSTRKFLHYFYTTNATNLNGHHPTSFDNEQEYYIDQECTQRAYTLKQLQEDTKHTITVYTDSRQFNQESCTQTSNKITTSLVLHTLTTEEEDGVITKVDSTKYPFDYTFTIPENLLKNKTVTNGYSNTVNITQNNITTSLSFTWTATLVKSLDTLTNGDFWYLYHNVGEDESQVIYEQALTIDSTLSEYWDLAYTASNYCDWFIPEHWQPYEESAINYFNDLLFIKYENDNSQPNLLNINDEWIPIVKAENNLIRYQVVYNQEDLNTAQSELNNTEFNSNYELASNVFNNSVGYNAMRYIQSDSLNWTPAVKTDGTIDQTTGLWGNIIVNQISTTNNYTYYYYSSGGKKHKDLIPSLSTTYTNASYPNYDGIYIMILKYLRTHYYNRILQQYDNALKEHNAVWDRIYKDYPNLVLESSYSDENATTSTELLANAQQAFKDFCEPENSYSMTIIDNIDEAEGYYGQELHIGDNITLNDKELINDDANYDENGDLEKNLQTKLFITEIKYKLRSDNDISLTVAKEKYQDKVMKRIAKLIA